MTLDQLANALRGTPRDARMMMQTPDGLREIRLVRGCYVRDDGSTGNAGGGARYAIVFLTGDEPDAGDGGKAWAAVFGGRSLSRHLLAFCCHHWRGQWK